MNNLLGGNHQGNHQGQAKPDYVDKALDSVERKFGGGKINPAQAKGVNEGITDKARETFEKVTGKHVPDKVSN